MARALAERGKPRSRRFTGIRVASVPENHVYVRHLAPLRDDGLVRRLGDPPPPDPAPVAGQWWPPAMLDPAWIRAEADRFDLMHVHFGFDALSAADLTEVVDALDAFGKPLVYTVHDLRNPHHDDSAAHDAALDVLVPRAAALITLTRGAAQEVRRRWGRSARVLPHPHVVELDCLQAAHPRKRDAYVVGIHAKSLRASMDPGPVVAALLPLTDELSALRLMVDVHCDVAEPDGARHDPALMALLNRASRDGLIELAVHDCFSDGELWDYLRSLDLSVLPYRFGTHSGWLEACVDLGTTVLAPTCGYLAEQRPCLTYGHDESGLDDDGLRAAVRRGYSERLRSRADPAQRIREREALAAAHRAIYESVLQ